MRGSRANLLSACLSLALGGAAARVKEELGLPVFFALVLLNEIQLRESRMCLLSGSSSSFL